MLWFTVFLNLFLITKFSTVINIQGPLKIEFEGDPPTFSELEKKYPEVKLGGFYQPSDCIAQHWVCQI